MNIAIYLAVVRVAFACLLVWMVCVGVGWLLRRLFTRSALTPADLLLLPWAGWGLIVAFLQIWHLFFPVTVVTAIVVSCTGFAGLMLSVRDVAELCALTRRKSLLTLLTACAIALWVANNAVRPPGVYDAGLYHITTIRWAREYAIVPGLGNLYGRLAFNNASFLFAAMLEVGPFVHRSHQVASAFLIWLAMLPCAHSVWMLVRRPQDAGVPQIFLALLAVPILAWSLNTGYVSSASPDVPVFLLSVMLSVVLLEWLDPNAGAPRKDALAVVLLLTMVGVAVKLTAGVFGALAASLALLIYARRTNNPRATLVAFIMAAGLALLVLLPWCVRSAILSGYPVFPLTVGRLSVDWAMPHNTVAGWVEVLQSYARDHAAPRSAVLHTWTWVGPWLWRTLRESMFDFTAPFALLLLACVSVLWRSRREPNVWRDARWAALLPAVAGEIAWFLSSPDPRYQAAMPWVLAAGTLSIGGRNWPRRGLVVLAVAALTGVIFVRPIDLVVSWKDPGPAPRKPMRIMTTESGLSVYVPENGDQCWDSDLPATPYFSRNLRLRVEGDLARGFTKHKALPKGQPAVSVIDPLP